MICFWLLLLICFPVTLTASSLDLGISNSDGCQFVYKPGPPTVMRPDTMRTGAFVRGWVDTDERIAGGLRQPVRHVYIVVPPGMTPVLETRGLRTHTESGGLARPAPEWRTAEISEAPEAFVKLASVFRWRDFRLAHVELYPVREAAGGAVFLDYVHCHIRFEGVRTGARTPKDVSVISRLALNGNVGAGWWEAPPRVRTISSWPDGDIYKLSVRETGLYQVTGAWLKSHGLDLIGRASRDIHLLGNGGRLLPRVVDTPRDSVLLENAIYIDDGGDRTFDTDDFFLFFGEALKGHDYIDEDAYLYDSAHHSPFSRDNTYFVYIDSDGPAGLRMDALPMNGGGGQLVTGTRGHVVRDEDFFIFESSGFSESGLVWFMATVASGEARSFVTSLPGVSDGSGFIRLDFKRQGGGNPLLTISLNETVIQENFYTDQPFDIPLSSGALFPGANTLTIENHGTQSTLLNYIVYEYARDLTLSGGEVSIEAPEEMTGFFRYELPGGASVYVADVSDPLHPRMGWGSVFVDSSRADAQSRYFASTSEALRTPQWVGKDVRGTEDYDLLRQSDLQADMIIITPDEWFDMMEPLKTFHETDVEEPLSVVRVKLSDIYDEFGWGNTDPVAIRDFLHFAHINWRGPGGAEEAPRYLLIVGDGNYDYRGNLATSDRNVFPPWEWLSTCTDDYYSEFDTTLPYMLTGRLPVQTAYELQVVLDKITGYGGNPLYGPWKNTATFVADDEYKNGCKIGEKNHTVDSEDIINSFLPPYFSFKKIYEIFYPFRSSPTGGFKPDATRDLIECINRGTLIVNYMGHGNPEVWTDEQVFVSNRDTPLLENGRMLPLFVAATCSWGQFDTPLLRCHPEILLTKPNAGAIACLAATRFTTPYSNKAFLIRFYTETFQQRLPRTSLGEALLLSKGASQSNAERYHLFGDPALRLATPEYRARVTNLSSDSLQALSLFTITGEVLWDTVNVWEDFEGIVEARVFDNEETAIYYWCGNENYPFEYRLPGNAIFRGTASVHNGRFSATFRVPKDVTFGGLDAKISLYFFGRDASGDSADGIGVQEHIPIASTVGTDTDSLPPAITAWLETESFQPGDPVSSSPLLSVAITDSSGINLSGEVGHKIVVRVDESSSEDLTPFFNYDLDSYTSGTLEKRLGPFSQGKHHLVIEAWDSFNNLNQQSLSFFVGEEGPAGFELRDVLNWPNPMKDNTYFTYFLTQPAAEVHLKIFTLTGKQVFSLEGLDTGYGFRSNKTRSWDGRDAMGHELANGVYFFKVIAKSAAGARSEKVGKLVILR